MHADLRDAERCDHVPPRLALRDRLALAALVAGVTLWIRVGELVAATRDREGAARAGHAR
jgi:hypothetical protein